VPGTLLPETKPEVFAPGILKPRQGFHSSVVFTSTGDTACWTEMAAGRTFCSTQVDGIWSRPEVLPFDPEYGVREPMFAHRDQRLYYLSRRPLAHDPVERERIWYVERTPSGWSEPRVIDPVVAAHPTHWQFSITADGDLFISYRLADETWTEAVNMGDEINSLHNETSPAVTPDGRYIFFLRVSGDVNNVFWVRADIIDRLRPPPGMSDPPDTALRVARS
jgi:hypothetical protein